MEEQSEQFIDQLLSQIDENDMFVESSTSSPNPLEPHPPHIGAVTERFCKPKSDEDVKQAQKNAEPGTTAKSTKWALKLWSDWAENRKVKHGDSPCMPPHLLSFEKINKWMCKFILEVRRQDGLEYPPNTLYCIACGIMRHIRQYNPELNFFTQAQFDGFKKTLDAEMKRLKAGGAGLQKRRVDPITFEEEEMLWKKGLLGTSSPQALLDTMVYMYTSIVLF